MDLNMIEYISPKYNTELTRRKNITEEIFPKYLILRLGPLNHDVCNVIAARSLLMLAHGKYTL